MSRVEGFPPDVKHRGVGVEQVFDPGQGRAVGAEREHLALHPVLALEGGGEGGERPVALVGLGAGDETHLQRGGGGDEKRRQIKSEQPQGGAG